MHADQTPAPAAQPEPNSYGRIPGGPGANADTETERASWRKWADTHCYGCGGELSTPHSQLTEEQLMDIGPDAPNIEHAHCFD